MATLSCRLRSSWKSILARSKGTRDVAVGSKILGSKGRSAPEVQRANGESSTGQEPDGLNRSDPAGGIRLELAEGISDDVEGAEGDHGGRRGGGGGIHEENSLRCHLLLVNKRSSALLPGAPTVDFYDRQYNL